MGIYHSFAIAAIATTVAFKILHQNDLQIPSVPYGIEKKSLNIIGVSKCIFMTAIIFVPTILKKCAIKLFYNMNVIRYSDNIL